jgi:hypothetical protein
VYEERERGNILEYTCVIDRKRSVSTLVLFLLRETVSPEQRGLSLKGLKGYYLSLSPHTLIYEPRFSPPD